MSEPLHSDKWLVTVYYEDGLTTAHPDDVQIFMGEQMFHFTKIGERYVLMPVPEEGTYFTPYVFNMRNIIGFKLQIPRDVEFYPDFPCISCTEYEGKVGCKEHPNAQKGQMCRFWREIH